MRQEKNGMYVGDYLYPLANHKSEHHINGVTYEVYSVFDGIHEKSNSISDKIFRIIEIESAHLIRAQDTAIINKEYACLTAREED